MKIQLQKTSEPMPASKAPFHVERRQLETYAQLLITVAKTHGLIGFDEAEVDTHIRRSLILLEIEEVGSATSVIDVGSGAGLPGIPIAIVSGGSKQIVLVEPRRRAVAFLEMVLRELDLECQVTPMTAQMFARSKMFHPADVVLARALAEPPVAVRICAPLARVGGAVVLTGSPLAAALDWGIDLDSYGLGEPRTSRLSGPHDITQHVHIIPKVT
ncbi:MAG: RsmG family class I SAM-dependent methyltransferase [Actinomycetota bacterium]